MKRGVQPTVSQKAILGAKLISVNVCVHQKEKGSTTLIINGKWLKNKKQKETKCKIGLNTKSEDT